MSHDEVIAELEASKTIWGKIKTLNGVDTVIITIAGVLLWIFLIEPIYNSQEGKIRMLEQELKLLKQVKAAEIQALPVGEVAKVVR